MLSPLTRHANWAPRVRSAPAIRRVDALMDIAEPFLQPHDGLAAGVKAEMAGFDDSGMHRPDGNLMQARAFRGEEGVRRRRGRARLAGAEGMADRPAAVIEPWPRIARADRREAVKVARARVRGGSRADAPRPPRGTRRRRRNSSQLQIGAAGRRQRHARLGPVAPETDEPAPRPKRAATPPRARRPPRLRARPRFRLASSCRLP